MTRTLFGTDGVRGKANRHPLTPEVCLALGRAVAHRSVASAVDTNNRSIVIGRDTRRSGELFEAALAAGCMSVGVDVLLAGTIPTPGVAYLTRSSDACAGLVISASHNPHWDNGIKIFGADGFKLSDDDELKIEALCAPGALTEDAWADPAAIGRSRALTDASDRYLSSLGQIVPPGQTLEGMRLVVDAANGACHQVAPRLFAQLGADVTAIGVEPDGININAGVGATSPRAAADLVAAGSGEIGVLLDGDGDRLALIDETGAVVDGDEVLAICALAMKARGTLRGGAVVATVMSNVGLEVALQAEGIELVRSAVGDRYVVQEMRRRDCNLGGEQSGHLVFLDHATTGDGLAAALVVLAEMGRSGQPLSSLRRVMTQFPQVKVNVAVAEKRPIDELVLVNSVIANAECALGKRGRVLVRYSGTEPKARVMVEGDDPSAVEQWADRIANALQDELKTS